MDNLKLNILTVCKINYNDNCHNCPLRINGKCEALTKDNEYNSELELITKDFLKNKSAYLYQSKDNQESIYLSNGRINRGNYLLAKLGEKENILVDELTLINNYNEIQL